MTEIWYISTEKSNKIFKKGIDYEVFGWDFRFVGDAFIDSLCIF
jgi:hypothetical protein